MQWLLGSALVLFISHWINKKEINYGKNYFPEKNYKGITYEAGEYESLVISLGEAEGNNWWCVMYPALCIQTASADLGDAVSSNAKGIATGNAVASITSLPHNNNV